MEKTTRRDFLLRLGATAVSPVLSSALPPFFHGAEGRGRSADEEMFRTKVEWADANRLSESPFGEIVGAIGRSFLDTPYVAHSLETSGAEELIVNLRAFDCVTFVESTLAIARCIRTAKTSFNDFRRELQRLRYRNSVLDGYASRLHYFSDWIQDNEKKGVVKNISGELGGETHRKVLNFMSTHRSSYPQLHDEVVLKRIEHLETEISQRPLQIISRSVVAEAEPRMQTGDIVALATSMAGIDFSHTGLAVVSEERVRYLHAPLSGGSVQLSPASLGEYVRQGTKSLTGISVVRPLDPVARP